MLKVPLADVIDMLGGMIKAIDEELSEEGLVSIGDTMLPHIQYQWDRLAALLRDRAIAAVTILPLVLSVSAPIIVGIVVLTKPTSPLKLTSERVNVCQMCLGCQMAVLDSSGGS